MKWRLLVFSSLQKKWIKTAQSYLKKLADEYSWLIRSGFPSVERQPETEFCRQEGGATNSFWKEF